MKAVVYGQTLNNNQYQNSKSQTFFNYGVIGYWNLFGAWNLVIGA
jgi:hypothetical protein